MKKRLPTSADELIKNHYGVSCQAAVSNTVKTEELLANYYGKPVRKGKKQSSAPAVVLSLSYDSGELLAQQSKREQFEKQVVQQSTTETPFEEYVVGESGMSMKRSVEASLQVPPAEEVSALQEYQVDVLQPLNGASVSARSTRPSEPKSPPSDYQAHREISATHSAFSADDTSRAKASEDDFIADMQSILSGQMVFDPVTRKTVAKDELNRSASGRPPDVNERPMPEAKNEQAIFDRIAQSMEYANKYDLGTVELENRFADFDKISELQQKAKETKSKNGKTASGQPSPAATVNGGDFIQDLDAIRNQRSTIISSQASTATNKWDRIANEVFGYPSYDDYIAQELKTSTFFGQSLQNLNSELIQRLDTVQADLTNSQGAGYNAPLANSTLRKKAGMHGWGMAIDFDIVNNPYVLNEHSEGQLDQELVFAYDHIADFILGKAQSDLRKLKSGRSAFGGGAIGDVYDVLREESDAMKRYFSLMDDDAGLKSFIEQEWPLKHSGQAPDIAKIKTQMKDDYEVLGGKTDTGGKRSTGGKGDRPFAPSSAGGRGDPATGFLNLGKEFVLAMTNAGFAWGAIDIAGEPGDMQHFDIRLQGTGARVYNLLLHYK
jgi:hypothetical protein